LPVNFKYKGLLLFSPFPVGLPVAHFHAGPDNVGYYLLCIKLKGRLRLQRIPQHRRQFGNSLPPLVPSSLCPLLKGERFHWRL
jgi:hypothetical protein